MYKMCYILLCINVFILFIFEFLCILCRTYKLNCTNYKSSIIGNHLTLYLSEYYKSIYFNMIKKQNTYTVASTDAVLAFSKYDNKPFIIFLHVRLHIIIIIIIFDK